MAESAAGGKNGGTGIAGGKQKMPALCRKNTGKYGKVRKNGKDSKKNAKKICRI